MLIALIELYIVISENISTDQLFSRNNGEMGSKRFDLVRWRKQEYRRSQAELASELGISYGMYKNYEYRPDQPIPEDILLKLVERGYRPEGQEVERGRVRKVAPAKVGLLKLVEPLSAGMGTATAGERTSSPATIPVPPEFAMEEFSGCVIEGDSMMPLIHEGDTCVFMDSKKPRNRMPFAVYLDGDTSAVLKELVYENGRWILRSWNSAYPDREIQEAVLRGYLIGVISKSGDLKIGPEYDGLTRAMFEEKLRGRLL